MSGDHRYDELKASVVHLQSKVDLLTRHVEKLTSICKNFNIP